MKILIYNNYAHAKNLSGFKLGCSILGYTCVESQDSSELLKEWDFVWIPSGHFEAPNAKKIMYGPHNFVFPNDSWFESKFNNRCFYNCLSDWVITLYNEFNEMGLAKKAYPFGVDIYSFDKKEILNNYKYDCFIYFKARCQNNFNTIIDLCIKKGLTVKILKYGSYNEEEYKDVLKNSKFGIWIGSHESQGFALQEALSTNTPLLVWDTKTMFEEIESNGSITYIEYACSKKLLSTTCTTWNNTCGIKFTEEEDAEKLLDKMLESWASFQPRDLIIKNLEPSVCLKRMME